MESEEEAVSETSSVVSRDYDGRQKRKKKASSSDDSRDLKGGEGYVVGMVAVTRKDGLFKDPHEVGRFVSNKLGVVRSVTVTRSGMVIIGCMSKRQMDNALKIAVFGKNDCVRVFSLGEGIKEKGVIGGVPVSFDEDEFLDVEGVCDVRRMKRFVDGLRVDSTLVCLTFERGIPERIYLDYVAYKVRPYEKAPLRCFCCLEYGHAAAVCRGKKRCVKCGRSDCCVEVCVVETVKCVHCGGPHYTGAGTCPKRLREVEIIKLRAGRDLSYAEAVKKVEGQGGRVVEKEVRVEETGVRVVVNSDRGEMRVNEMGSVIGVHKPRFLAFIAMVVNCAMDVGSKSERIKLVLDAARRFLGVVDVSGEELTDILRDGCAPTPTV